ncbi:MAG: hypothetical protein QOH90_2309, partial [Actinomycetota bacterium]|nr:hypothetical protein [Actinomycetota bacterium]
LYLYGPSLARAEMMTLANVDRVTLDATRRALSALAA